MILSHAQIKAVNICPDCARREVSVITCASFEQLHDAMHEQAGMCIAALRDHLSDIPMNLIEVHHDEGCPKLTNYVPGTGEEVQIRPVELSEDHAWVRKAAELGVQP